jgi:hypothetical protein
VLHVLCARFILYLESEGRTSNNASVMVEIADEALPECDITYFSTGKVSFNRILPQLFDIVLYLQVANGFTMKTLNCK